MSDKPTLTELLQFIMLPDSDNSIDQLMEPERADACERYIAENHARFLLESSGYDDEGELGRDSHFIIREHIVPDFLVDASTEVRLDFYREVAERYG